MSKLKDIPEKFRMLKEASLAVGSLNCNRGTIAGNIYTSSPAADTLLPCSLWIKLKLVSSKGERMVNIEDVLPDLSKYYR